MLFPNSAEVAERKRYPLKLPAATIEELADSLEGLLSEHRDRLSVPMAVCAEVILETARDRPEVLWDIYPPAPHGG